jgi:hypothetical protein
MKTGSQLRIQNEDWQNAVAFEVYDTNGQLMQVAIVGTGDISLNTTKIYYPTNADKVFAVGFDGQKILVYPDTMSTDEMGVSEIKIYPNPIAKGEKLHFKSEWDDKVYLCNLYSMDGSVLLEFKGSLKQIENNLNQKFSGFETGVYILNLKDSNGKLNRIKFIRK